MNQFNEAGISFRYPANWRLEREPTDDGWTVLVQSPATTFLMLTCDPGLPTPAEMADTALEALRSEYPDLESESQIETLAGGGTGMPRSSMSCFNSASVSGWAIADCTPTRTRPRA